MLATIITEDSKIMSECELHDWAFGTDDDIGCPVCYGISIERQRIINVMYTKAASRNIFEALEHPYSAKELEDMIREGQDD
jgi:hypothetical protein